MCDKSGLGLHCLSKMLLKNLVDDKAYNICCDWHFKDMIACFSFGFLIPSATLLSYHRL